MFPASNLDWPSGVEGYFWILYFYLSDPNSPPISWAAKPLQPSKPDPTYQSKVGWSPFFVNYD